MLLPAGAPEVKLPAWFGLKSFRQPDQPASQPTLLARLQEGGSSFVPATDCQQPVQQLPARGKPKKKEEEN